MNDAGEFLQLMLLSIDNPEGARIVQCCVKDHSRQSSPHLHVQVHMKDAGGETLSSEWSLLNNVSLPDLKLAANLYRGNVRGNVRFHMHEDEPARVRCDSRFLAELETCTHTLTEAEASTLQAEERGDCPVCLVDVQSGDGIVFLPCDGRHSAHWSCLNPWLQEAATCPQCRFALPVEGRADAGSIDELVAKSHAAVERLQAASKVKNNFCGSPPRRSLRSRLMSPRRPPPAPGSAQARECDAE